MKVLSFILFCFCDWWWLLWLLPFILGWLLGSSFGSSSWKSKYEGSQKDLDECRRKSKALKSDLDECRASKSRRSSGLATSAVASSSVAAAAPLKAVKKEEPKASGRTGAWAKLKDDNLQFVEGIGPKMNQVLNENGYNSWAKVAKSNRDELKSMLDKYGDKYKIIEPGDWPRQAKFAAEGDWDGLIKYQSDDGSAAKVRTLFIKLGIMDQEGKYKA